MSIIANSVVILKALENNNLEFVKQSMTKYRNSDLPNNINIDLHINNIDSKIEQIFKKFDIDSKIFTDSETLTLYIDFRKIENDGFFIRIDDEYQLKKIIKPISAIHIVDLIKYIVKLYFKNKDIIYLYNDINEVIDDPCIK